MRAILPRFWAWPSQLRKRGVLGINRRNLNYLFEANPRSVYKLADDKAVTKTICREHGIPVPETYAVIKRFGDLQQLSEIIDGRDEFVVKPAGGSGGRGVLVIIARNNGLFDIANGQMISLSGLRYHISTTLSGLYSLAGQPDHVILEQRIVPHPVFEKLAVRGTPDTRIIMYRGSPVMAMLRLPTKASKGRANLHQGAVAVGINLQTGHTFGGVCFDRAVTIHPDTGIDVGGVTIPCWDEVLRIAGNVSNIIKIGYIGIDIMLDAQHGPLVLEVNARPGLSVQIANRCGLLPTLQQIDSKLSSSTPVDASKKLVLDLAQVHLNQNLS